MDVDAFVQKVFSLLVFLYKHDSTRLARTGSSDLQVMNGHQESNISIYKGRSVGDLGLSHVTHVMNPILSEQTTASNTEKINQRNGEAYKVYLHMLEPTAY